MSETCESKDSAQSPAVQVETFQTGTGLEDIEVSTGEQGAPVSRVQPAYCNKVRAALKAVARSENACIQGDC
jgi:hypothetical protein